MKKEPLNQARKLSQKSHIRCPTMLPELIIDLHSSNDSAQSQLSEYIQISLADVSGSRSFNTKKCDSEGLLNESC